MKKTVIWLVLPLVLLVGSFSLRAYDLSPSLWKVVPECIWASATGGGTWVTEIQITNTTSTATGSLYAFFLYGGGSYRTVQLTSSLAAYNTLKYTNILSSMDVLDTGTFDYYGRVGAVWFQGTYSTLQVTAKTVNGNFGKTFPGLSTIAGTTAAYARTMMIHGLTNNSTYRTFAGFVNTSDTNTYVVNFVIYGTNYSQIGSVFSKTFVPYDFKSFNPFVEAGVGSGSYDNCWLYYYMSSGSSDGRGIMGFGSIANNTSNDPAALLPYPWTGTSSTEGPTGMPFPQ